MLDNSFQVRYDKLPIATYAVSEPPLKKPAPFMLTHHHREFEVIAVVEGRCEVTIDQTLYPAAAGDLLLIPPYSLHSGRILPGAAFSHFCFCFDLSLLKEADFSRQLESGYLDVTRVVHGGAPDSRALAETAHCIYTQCIQHRRGWEFLVRGQLLSLIGLLEQRGALFSIISSDVRCDFGARVLDLVSQTYHTDITSRDLAARMSYSQSYFCRLFRENFSLSFQEYLCQYRLSKARLLLTQNGGSVGEVAAKVGFNSPSYFARRFRALYGCTPKKFQAIQSQPDDFGGYYLGTSVRLNP